MSVTLASARPAGLAPGTHEQNADPGADETESLILHVPEPGDPEYLEVAERGAVRAHRYLSRAHDRRRECWVYTPPGYDAPESLAKSYPLLVLQHAGADTHQTWVAKGNVDWLLDALITEGRAVSMIVLMLDNHPGGEPLYFDPTTRPAATEDLRRELFEDALPLVEARYRVERSRELRALAGPSVGGGQMLGIGLGNLDRFAWIGVFSAGYAVPGLLQSALAAPALTNAHLRLLWIACATEDEQFANNLAFIATLDSLGIRHHWSATPGEHTWPVWRRDLTEFLERVFQPCGVADADEA
ncbi:MAG: esterase family protein [Burkholderiales bacterium]|nr:esterase family protein [Opitutaceae bacterium]